MQDETPITVNRNPAQTVSSVVKLFGFRVRGNSIYIFFAGLAVGVVSAMIAYQVSIVAAAVCFIIPPVGGVVFIRVFTANRSRQFFFFWLDQKINGPYLRKPLKKRRSDEAA